MCVLHVKVGVANIQPPLVSTICLLTSAWRCHQMETFSASLALCAGNSPVTGEFNSQRSVTWSFDASLICALNKRLSKQSRAWWFHTPSRSCLRHCNGTLFNYVCFVVVIIAFMWYIYWNSTWLPRRQWSCDEGYGHYPCCFRHIYIKKRF